MVFFAAALVDAHAAVALGASVLGQPCVSAERGGSPLRRSRACFCPESLAALCSGLALGERVSWEVYPRRCVAGHPAEIKDLYEGQVVRTRFLT